MKKIISFFLLILLACSCTACAIQHKDVPNPETDGIELPADFAFTVTWGAAGDCFYDSKSGELSNYRNGNRRSNTCYVKMSTTELKTVYKYLCADMDITAYPASYTPYDNPSDNYIVGIPYETFTVTVTANGVTATVSWLNKYTGGDIRDAEAEAFLTMKTKLCGLIEAFPEWENLGERPYYC